MDDLAQSMKTMTLKATVTDILKTIKFTCSVVINNGTYLHSYVGHITEATRNALISAGIDTNFYHITKTPVNSIYTYLIAYTLPMGAEEIKRYQKTMNTRTTNAAAKAKAKTEREQELMAKIESVAGEFKAWHDAAEKRYQTILNRFKSSAEEYCEKIYSEVDLGPLQEKLLAYQVKPTKVILNALLTTKRAVIGNETGTGKTYQSLVIGGIMRQRGLIRNIVAVVPDTILIQWRRASQLMGIPIDNYYTIESFKGKHNMYVERIDLTVESSMIGETMNECARKGWFPYIYKKSSKSRRSSAASATTIAVSPAKQTTSIICFKVRDTYKKDTLFIIDEAHKCSGNGSLNGIIFRHLAVEKCYSLALSATIAYGERNINNLIAYAEVFGEKAIEYSEWQDDLLMKFKMPEQFDILMKSTAAAYVDREMIANIAQSGPKGSKFYHYKINPLQVFHHYLFPYRGHRINRAELGSEFPENQIYIMPFDMKENGHKIQENYARIKKIFADSTAVTFFQKTFMKYWVKFLQNTIDSYEMGELRKMAADTGIDIDDAKLYDNNINRMQNLTANPLTRALRLRQEISILKIDDTVDFVVQLLQEGNAVVIYTTFIATATAIYSKLMKPHKVDDDMIITPRPSIIFDESKMLKGGYGDRQSNVDKFQNNTNDVIIVTTQSGGVGLDLHDLHGKGRAAVFNDIPDSPTIFKQALGRINRIGAKSKAIQYIICCAGSIEEGICDKARAHIMNMDMINDGEANESFFRKNILGLD
jgi:superfamily II DNA or RNA helicase